MNSRNIAIAAHVDAGKTTLSERLLYLTRAIPQLGEVEDGLATLDFLEEEQRRGITIESGLASCQWKNHDLHFIDTPGHIDFTTEVDPFFLAAENALLLISGAEGLEPQTLSLYERMVYHGCTPFLFINKLDGPHYHFMDLCLEIEEKWSREALPMTFPLYQSGHLVGVVDILHEVAAYTDPDDIHQVHFRPVPESEKELLKGLRKNLLDSASKYHHHITQLLLEGQEVSIPLLYEGLRLALEKGEIIPVYCGSAKLSIGLRLLLNGLVYLSKSFEAHLPVQLTKLPILSKDTPPEGTVLQVRHIEPHGYLGITKIWNRIKLPHACIESFFQIQASDVLPLTEVEAGRVVFIKLKESLELKWGSSFLGDVWSENKFKFQPPLLWQSIEAQNPQDAYTIQKNAAILAKCIPGLVLRKDENTGNDEVGGWGEVQLDVFFERLQKKSLCPIKMGHPQVDFLETINQPTEIISLSSIWGEHSFEVFMQLSPQESMENTWIFPEYFQEFEIQFLAKSLANWAESGFLGKGPIRFLKFELVKIQYQNRRPPHPMLAKVLLDCLRLRLNSNNFKVLEPLMEMICTLPMEYSGKVLGDLESRKAQILTMENHEKIQKIKLNIFLNNIIGYTTLLRSLTKGQGSFVLKYVKHGSG